MEKSIFSWVSILNLIPFSEMPFDPVVRLISDPFPAGLMLGVRQG